MSGDVRRRVELIEELAPTVGRETAVRLMHERLEQAIGNEATDTLTSEIASLRGEQLATRHDVELLPSDMRADFAELRGETRGAIAELRAEMHEQLGAVHGLIAAQTRQLGFWMLGAMTTLAALAFGAASLQ